MNRVGRRMGIVLLGLLGVAGAGLAGVPIATNDDYCKILRELRPDFARYVGKIRVGGTRFHPANLYMGLVRDGGRDPNRLEDAPALGRGVRNDIIVYADSREAGRSLGWAMLLIDHEYFHARHLARGDRTPVPLFGDPEIDRHYYEAVAWGYNLAQADEDEYPTLTHADYLEAFRNYSMHFEAFRDYVLRHDRTAWAHYRRFLPDPVDREPFILAQK